jgi:subtilisin family serine protease
VATRHRYRRPALLAVVVATALISSPLAGLAQASPGSTDPAGSTGRIDPARAIVGGSTASAKGAATKDTSVGTGRYIVQLAEPPVTTYAGGVSGLPATRPAAGRRLDPQSTAARKYRTHLQKQRTAVLSDARVGTPDTTYTTALNGFAAKLSADQVKELRRDDRVTAVTESRLFTVPDLHPESAAGFATRSRRTLTPGSAIEAPAPAPATTADAGSGSTASGPATGKDVVIGVIDTGIWPESPSFARSIAGTPPGWHGACDTGVMWTFTCNGKIIGARFFADGIQHTSAGLGAGEVLTPRDTEGHGTHTASTAAGIPVAHTVIDGVDHGPISGVAPDARIAVYKALWENGGTDEDVIAAIDSAVADGVNVINYSIGSGEASDPPKHAATEAAMLNASLAGVFVATAAGNDADQGLVDNDFPWTTTVAAAATRRNEGTIELGNGKKLVGFAVDDLTGPAALPLVYGAGPDAVAARYCVDDSLDAEQVKGKIVACQAGAVSIPELKSKGAAGLIMFSADGGGRHFSTLAGFPMIYLPEMAQADTLLTYLRYNAGKTTARLTPGGDGSSAVLPSIVDFSSKGPDPLHRGLLKPDVAADGVDVVAAVSPVYGGREFDVYSGTSMATPHIAGMAALLKQIHPAWTPSAISSALRTTASDTKGTTNPYWQGAGLADVSRAADPGVVFEADPQSWIDFAHADDPDGREINEPAVGLREYETTRPIQLTRTLTSVSTRKETYTANVAGLKLGTSVSVSPRTVTLAPGASATVKITVARGSAPYDTFDYGTITWRSPAHTVRIPVAARAWGVMRWTAFAQEGSFDYLRIFQGGTWAPIQTGFTGTMKTRTTGFGTVTWTQHTIRPSTTGDIFYPDGPGVQAHRIVVPQGTAGLGLQISADDPEDAIQAYLYKDGKMVRWAGSDQIGHDEADLFMPKAGVYTLYVHAARADSTPINYRFGKLLLARDANYHNATISVPTSVHYYDNLDALPVPTTSLPPGEAYAYVEFSRGGTSIPGLLIRN